MNKANIGILLIDDDDTFRGRLASAFRKRGLDAYEASNSSTALAYIRDKKPGLAVLDMRLVNENGLDILKEIREVDSKIKVTVLTGYGTIVTAIEAIKLGAVNYLTKPVDADAILASFNNDKPMEDFKFSPPPLEQVEWEHINRVVNDCSGNISKASKALGLHRRSLQRKLNKVPSRLK